MNNSLTSNALISLLVTGIALGIFSIGWWMGKSTNQDMHSELRLNAMQEKLEQINERKPAVAALPAQPTPRDNPAQRAIQDVSIGAAPSIGPEDAPVTIVAFSDFQCPFCARVVPALETVSYTHLTLPTKA